MAVYKSCLILLIVFCAASVLARSAVIGKNEEHATFFMKLNEQEKAALMALAISHHDVSDITPPENFTHTLPITPLIKPSAAEIPGTLFSIMMNGEVPKEWMKEFIKWILTDLKITTHSLNEFRTNADANLLCQKNNLTCYKLKDLGQNCCPFG